MKKGLFSSRSSGAQAGVIVVCMTILLCVSLILPPAAGPADAAEKTGRPKIGLALGGGGAKGAAHLGVIRVLEELRIPIDYIAGTSMGAIVGALYASGMSPERMEQVLTKVDWDDLFKDNPERREIDFRRKQEDFTIVSKLAVGIKDGKVMVPRGFIAGQKVELLFKTLMIDAAGINDFDKLPIPYRAVAADLETGEMVVIGTGDLADAARASMSIPAVFPPAEIKGRILIDGGIVRNLPVDIVRKMGADVIIAIDVGQPLLGRDDLNSPVAIMNQMVDIMMKKNVEEQVASLTSADVFIHPALGDITAADFTRGEEAARLGEETARKQVKELARYSMSVEEYRAFIAGQRQPEIGAVKIASVRVEGLEKVSAKAVEEKMSLKPGDTVTGQQLMNKINLVYGMDDFERVGIELTPKGDAYDLLVQPREKYWGPNYLRAGLRLATNFEGDSSFDIAIDYTMRWINSLGAEWKNYITFGNRTGFHTEFDQPLVADRLFFVSPYASWNQRNWNVFINNESVAQYRFRKFYGGVDLGIQPYNYGEGRIGVQFGKGSASLKTGSPQLPEVDYTIGALTARFVLDQLDNVNFPTKGYGGRVSLYSSVSGLGADDSYNKFDATVTGALTQDKNTFVGFLKYGTRIGNDLPGYDLFTLGGFLNLSGLYPDQLFGDAYAMGGVAVYRQLGKSAVGTLYLGGSLEAGNTWYRKESPGFNDLVYAGSVFVGADTILGPAYLALGYAEGGRTALYFYIGKAFGALQ